jgi:ABC-type transport system involved in cytochrome c biogenesis permease subunit
VATAFVLALTACARSLGPQLSGLIAPFPIYGLVVAAFTQSRQGTAAVAGLLRANVLGSLAFIAFFLIAGGCLGHAPVVGVYGLAALASAGTGGAAFLASRNRRIQPRCGA